MRHGRCVKLGQGRLSKPADATTNNLQAKETHMEMESLQELWIDELRDLYSAENQLLKALPKMAKKASAKELQKAFQTHLKETEGHVERLKKIFDQIGKKPTGKKCAAMEGLVEEGKEMMGEDMDDDVMDAALISVAQKVEHYEIGSYGTVRTWAKLMGDDQSARLLQQTLDEEGKTDKLLTGLSEKINVEAMQPN
jgi:ferritin-like metal-binding protein YciE